MYYVNIITKILGYLLDYELIKKAKIRIVWIKKIIQTRAKTKI